MTIFLVRKKLFLADLFVGSADETKATHLSSLQRRSCKAAFSTH